MVHFAWAFGKLLVRYDVLLGYIQPAPVDAVINEESTYA